MSGEGAPVPLFWELRGQARLTETGELERVERGLRRRQDQLDAGDLTKWAAVRCVLRDERGVELPPMSGALR